MEDDTIKLLRECNAGIKMGISSLEDALDKVENKRLYSLLQESKDTHCRLGSATHRYLREYHDEGKEPAPIAKMMSKVKTDMKVLSDRVDAGIADLITDGCNMGTKSLYRYLNQYSAAEEKIKELTREIIGVEEKLIEDLRVYL